MVYLGISIVRSSSTSVCNALLKNNIDIEHACDQVCACTTCHVIIKEGFDTLEPSDENEDDMLDKAWRITPESRLSCPTRVEDDLTIEITNYTIKLATAGKPRGR